MADPPTRPTLQERLRAATTARVALGRVGTAIPTKAVLDFQLAHARARDAVHAALEPGELGSAIRDHPVIEVHSQAPDRTTYLMRPDLGRRLDAACFARLDGERSQLAIVVADGLSATAVRAHAGALVQAIVARADSWQIGPIVIAHQARVAIGDDIGSALAADLSVVLIGERPGLSAADSLGAYISWAPRRGRLDSERNCVSNIRPPHGWSIDAAADEILRIADRARHLGCTGVAMAAGAWIEQARVLPEG